MPKSIFLVRLYGRRKFEIILEIIIGKQVIKVRYYSVRSFFGCCQVVESVRIQRKWQPKFILVSKNTSVCPKIHGFPFCSIPV